MSDLSLSFLTENPILVSLGLVVLIALSYLLYRKNNPPIQIYLKILLLTLRVIAVLSIILVLSQPVFSYNKTKERTKNITILIDNSLSMQREFDKISREEKIEQLLESDTYRWLQNNFKLNRFYFGSNLSADMANTDREATALGDILNETSSLQLNEPIDHLLLFSDGNSNAGIDPAISAGRINIPIAAVDMSGEFKDIDLGITDIEFNEIMYVGQENEIKVKFSWSGLPNSNLQINLSEKNKDIASSRFQTVESDGQGEVVLKYRPTEPGEKLVEIKLPTLENDINPGNNSKTVSLNVLKSKLKILILAEYADYEIGFLKRTLDNISRFETELRITDREDGNLSKPFPSSQPELNQFDLLILYDPTPTKLESKIQLLNSYLTDKGGSILVVMGENFATKTTSNAFAQILPFYTSSDRAFRYGDFNAQPSEDQLYHPSVRIGETQNQIRQTWADTPPFELLVMCDQKDPQAEILTSVNYSGRNYPVTGFKRVGAGRVMALSAAPLWHWSFIPLGYDDDNSAYLKFVEGTAGWLTVNLDSDPIQLEPDKKVYHRGEPIKFKGFAYDLGYRPLPDVTGSLTLINKDLDETTETDLNETTEGNFEVTLNHLVPGNYEFSGEYSKDGSLLKEIKGELLIEPFSLEEFDQSGKPEIMQLLAGKSGGLYLEPNNFETLAEQFDPEPVSEQLFKEIKYKNQWWLLLIFIGALSAEWLLRKMNQLV